MGLTRCYVICWWGKQGDREHKSQLGTPQRNGTGGLTVKQMILGQGRVTCSPSAGLSYIHEAAVHVWDLMVSGLGYTNAHVLGTDLMEIIVGVGGGFMLVRGGEAFLGPSGLGVTVELQ